MKIPLCLAMLAAASVVLGAAPGDAAAVPTQVSFAGRLVDADGPVDGTVELGFRLFSGSSQVWSEDHPSVTATDGLVFAALGSVNPLDADLFAGGALSLEIAVDGQVLGPRLDLLSVPYAMRAGAADTADRLGTLAPADVALASHDHAGAYLPLGATLTCPGTQKVTGLDGASGQPICGADLSTSYTAGAGLALAGTVFSVATGGITAAHLATDSVGTAEIDADSVGVAEIATNAVGAAEIVTDAVGPAEIATGAVGSAEISTDAVGSSEIAANAVGPTELEGAEITIYVVNDNGCVPGPGSLMSTTTCETGACGPGGFFSCAGSCNQVSPQTCANAVVGRILDPTF